MNWYYKGDSGKFGPFTETEIKSLVLQGSVTDTTLVWNEVSGKWRPYGEIAGEDPAAAAASIPMAPAPAPDSYRAPQPATGPPQADGAWDPFSYLDEDNTHQSVGATGPTARCSECGKDFPEEELLKYGDARLCAACKPLYFQRIKEGVPASVEMRYAGFWIRVLAKIIDGIVVSFATMIPFAIIFMFAFSSSNTGAFAALMIPLTILSYALPIFYETFFVGRFGATPGKMLLKLKIVRPDGSRVRYLRAFSRFMLPVVVSLAALGIAMAIAIPSFRDPGILFIVMAVVALLTSGIYIMAAFDSEKRALHDHVCGTRVIKVRSQIA